MPGKTNIEWTDRSWNPTVGCTQVSPGCAHCYAKTLTERFNGKGSFDTLVLHPDRLEAPLHWRTPRRVFVNSMSDLFHEDVPFEFIDRVFAVMALTPQHTYQVLTKRPQRMREYMQERPGYITDVIIAMRRANGDHGVVVPLPHIRPGAEWWPLPNVWLGVTVENQHFADERIPVLLDTPAAVRFISAEPLLGPVDLDLLETESYCKRCGIAIIRGPGNTYNDEKRLLKNCVRCGYRFRPSDQACEGGIDWVIVGGESGPRHRPFDPDWARSLLFDCRAAGIAAFVKQMGGPRPGNKLEDLPEDLRVREFPEVRA